MDMMTHFVKQLNLAGVELDKSKYSEHYNVRKQFSCPNLDDSRQVPVLLIANVSEFKVYLSLSHGLSIMLTPYDQPVNWTEIDEAAANSLAASFAAMYLELERRANALMSPL